MKRKVFTVAADSYNGAWYPTTDSSRRGMILMLGDSAEDRMAATGAKWLNRHLWDSMLYCR